MGNPFPGVIVPDAFEYAVEAELKRAREKFPRLNSAHEAYAVILEELDEYWEEVRKPPAKRTRDAMFAELVQIAAMAQRAAEDTIFYEIAAICTSMAKERGKVETTATGCDGGGGGMTECVAESGEGRVEIFPDLAGKQPNAALTGGEAVPSNGVVRQCDFGLRCRLRCTAPATWTDRRPHHPCWCDEHKLPNDVPLPNNEVRRDSAAPGRTL